MRTIAKNAFSFGTKFSNTHKLPGIVTVVPYTNSAGLANVSLRRLVLRPSSTVDKASYQLSRVATHFNESFNTLCHLSTIPFAAGW